MQWTEIVHDYTAPIKPVKVSAQLKQRLISFIDLTSLNESDDESVISRLCDNAIHPQGHVAAVCIYPEFLPQVSARLMGTPVKIATVVNFPDGSDPLESVTQQVDRAIKLGAQEIDVVFPYGRYLAGEQKYARTFVEECKKVCGEAVLLKVILETGALMDPVIIADAAYEVFGGGADFIKTSTGKIAEGASLEAVAAMLLVIKHVTPQLQRNLGLKISGGIRETQQAAQYLTLCEQIMGNDWPNPATLRFGASKLLDELLA